MKLLFDNNLSVKFPEIAKDHFPYSMHVYVLDLSDEKDIDILNFAKKEGYTIATKNEDFYFLSTVKGSPSKVVWLMLGNMRNRETFDYFRKHETDIKKFLKSSKDMIML